MRVNERPAEDLFGHATFSISHMGIVVETRQSDGMFERMVDGGAE